MSSVKTLRSLKISNRDESKILTYLSPTKVPGIMLESDEIPQDLLTMLAMASLLLSGATILTKNLALGWGAVLSSVLAVTSSRASYEGSTSVSTVTFALMSTFIVYNQKYAEIAYKAEN